MKKSETIKRFTFPSNPPLRKTFIYLVVVESHTFTSLPTIQIPLMRAELLKSKGGNVTPSETESESAGAVRIQEKHALNAVKFLETLELLEGGGLAYHPLLNFNIHLFTW